jgi:hypothetical protein
MCPVAVRSRVLLSLPIQPTNYLQMPPHSEEATQAIRARQELQSCLGGAIDTECVGALLGLLSVPVFLALIGPCRWRIAQAGRGGGGGERMWCLPGSANSPDSTDRRTVGVKW